MLHGRRPASGKEHYWHASCSSRTLDRRWIREDFSRMKDMESISERMLTSKRQSQDDNSGNEEE